MGGINEQTLAGLRIHIKDEDIHIHDDTKRLKFSSDLEKFKMEINRTFRALEKKDGLVEIPGTGDTLCVVKRGKIFSLIILNRRSIKEKLSTYLKAS